MLSGLLQTCLRQAGRKSTNFLAQPATKTVQSVKWHDDDASSSDIIRRNDIDEVF